MSRFFLIILSWLACSSGGQAGIRLDKLTACDDINELLDLLPLRTSRQECTQSSGPLITALSHRLVQQPPGMCVLREAPISLLEEFTCIQLPAGTGTDLTCFRPVGLDDVNKFKTSFETKYLNLQLRYLRDASKCSAANGAAAPAQPTLMPGVLGVIAKFEFGFVQGLGQKKPPESLAMHGYATLDPSLDLDTSAIEFFQILARVPQHQPSAEERVIGPWRVSIDEMKEVDSALNEAYRKARAPARVRSRSFNFTRIIRRETSERNKLGWQHHLRSSISDELEEEAFKELNSSEFPEEHRQIARMLDGISEHQPYNWRDRQMFLMSRDVSFFVNPHRPRCANMSGGSAIAVALFITEPVPDVMNDYGGIDIAVIAAGGCSRLDPNTRTYIDEIVEVASNRLLAELDVD